MKPGTKVRVMDPKKMRFMWEGIITEPCPSCASEGYEGYYVTFEDGYTYHYLRDQLKEMQ